MLRYLVAAIGVAAAGAGLATEAGSVADLQYLQHSGWIVRTAKHVLVFDYVETSPQGNELALDLRVTPGSFDKRRVVVFVSHGHADHFSPVGADVLPAGVWFGYAKAIGGGNITFDLACFFTGDAAAAAAIADGEEVFDFYIRNQNPKLYTVPISPTAEVWYVDMISGPEPAPIPLASWPTPDSFTECPGDYCPVWLYVNDGAATGIVEQYLPLVKTVVGRLAMTLPAHAATEDLYSAGLVGLLNAVRRYNPRTGVLFETYAWPQEKKG